ncbi:MAG: phosphoribosyltransferase domain-containing protein [Prevotellaceae bacterium]|jgi:xanthine phosphoribosyltransferase|nr:phosphoribosyltransferase domain-containing protein [Prevotellaceae bacterium]
MAKTLEEAAQRIREISFAEKFDTVVAIANGGIIPAAMLNQRLNCEIFLVKLSLRDAQQKPIYSEPHLLEPLNFDPKGRTILLVEDRVKTGATLEKAKQLLSEAKILRTFAVNGNADYCLYNEACFNFPWIL